MLASEYIFSVRIALAVQLGAGLLLLGCSGGRFGSSNTKDKDGFGHDHEFESGIANCDEDYVSDCYVTSDVIETLEDLQERAGIAKESIGAGAEEASEPNRDTNRQDIIERRRGEDVLFEDTIVVGDSMDTASFCSRNGTESAETNILNAESAVMKVYPLGKHFNSVLTTAPGQGQTLREGIINRGEIDGSVLAGVLQSLPNGAYTFQLCDSQLQSDCQIDGKWLEDILGDWEDLEEAPKGTIGAAALVMIEDQKITSHTRFGALFPRAEDGLTHDCDEVNSPLILDFDGSGIQLSSPLNGVTFDMKGQNFKSQISWPLRTNTGFLALDKNGNGRIDNIHELFGNNTSGPDGRPGKNGFDTLRKYDVNRDGKIDPKDPIYRKLQIWSDVNRNGSTQQGELSSIRSWGVQWISVKYKVSERYDIYGNLFRETSTFGISSPNGNNMDLVRPVVDVWFRTLPIISQN